MSTIEYHPIGVIHTPFPEPAGMPIQPSRGRGVRGTVELEPEYAEALADLDGFSHLILLYHLHRSLGWQARVVPFLDTVPRGLFATRSPRRPNPIGLSVVRLVGIEGAVLTIEDLDIVDGTPLLDIKPYVDEFDRRDELRLGWLEEARKRSAESDGRFSR
jgi:tRNA-Thr(GGU) m(6)t(6)A37 methyltransferase TsaA